MNISTHGTLTREQAAKYLNVSLPTLDAFLHRYDNPLPCIRAGRKYLVPLASIEAWLISESSRQAEGRRFDA